MQIAEIYESVQGEGEFTGTPSVFIRTTGCNLRCWFCDSPFTSWKPEGEQISVADIVEQTTAYEPRHVVVTGGEPMLFPEIVDLNSALAEAGCFITVETAGTVFRPVQADLMSISPKLSNSTPTSDRSEFWSKKHEEIRDQPDVIRELVRQYNCQFKFVIDQPGDVDEVVEYVSRFSEIDADRVWLMPQAVTREQLAEKTDWLTDAAFRNGFRFTSRRHIELFGNARGH